MATWISLLPKTNTKTPMPPVKQPKKAANKCINKLCEKDLPSDWLRMWSLCDDCFSEFDRQRIHQWMKQLDMLKDLEELEQSTNVHYERTTSNKKQWCQWQLEERHEH